MATTTEIDYTVLIGAPMPAHGLGSFGPSPFTDRAFAAIRETPWLVRGGRAGMVTVSLWAVRGDTPSGRQVYRKAVPPAATEEQLRVLLTEACAAVLAAAMQH